MFVVVKKKFIVSGIGIVTLFVLIGLLRGMPSKRNLFKQPLLTLIGGREDLAVLEVSGHIDPLEQATRRLFKPWGRLHVTRRFPGPPMPPQQLEDLSSDPQRQ